MDRQPRCANGLKIEKSKIYQNLEILDDREKEVVVGRFGLEAGAHEVVS